MEKILQVFKRNSINRVKMQKQKSRRVAWRVRGAIPTDRWSENFGFPSLTVLSLPYIIVPLWWIGMSIPTKVSHSEDLHIQRTIPNAAMFWLQVLPVRSAELHADDIELDEFDVGTGLLRRRRGQPCFVHTERGVGCEVLQDLSPWGDNSFTAPWNIWSKSSSKRFWNHAHMAQWPKPLFETNWLFWSACAKKGKI